MPPRWGEEQEGPGRVEEKEGPMPRRRSAAVFTPSVGEEKDHQSRPNDNIRGPATEMLDYTNAHAESVFDVSMSPPRGAGNSSFDMYAAANLPRDVDGRNSDDPKRSPDAFDVLAQVFDFQKDSVRNQRDSATSMLASRLTRAVGKELGSVVVSEEDIGKVLDAFHGELMSNYTRWCSFLGVNPVSLRALFRHPQAEEAAKATEAALMLLIWGEAGNLRFCPEFLCFLFHKMCATFSTVVEGKSPGTTVPSYLDQVIVPAYNLLAGQVANIGHKVINHAQVRNYDDFNEIFWQESCLKLTIATMFDSELKKKFQKTFVERQSWLVPIFSFWRVYVLHIVGLHIMIVGAKRQEGLGERSVTEWGETVITLYACSLVKDLWEIKQAASVFVGVRGPFGQLLLNTVRGGIKAAIVLLLLVLYWADENEVLFPMAAAVFFILAVVVEAVMLTELWWGISSYGKWGASTERSCSGGGFAGCVPSSLRQLSWSFVGSMCGINAVNLYTQVHSLPPIGKRLAYIGFWAIVLTTKISFSYFVVIRKMTTATYTLYYAEGGTEYDLGLLGIIEDTHNYVYIVALWVGNGLIYFLDMQIWFVVWANIAAACEGVRRRVGEINDSSQVVRAFSQLHKKFFEYLNNKLLKTTMHTRFAHIWNEIVDAMREEDILSHRERLQLRYFLINLRRPRNDPDSRNPGFDAAAPEGDWGPCFALLPEFLMSGAVQRAVQSATEFGANNKALLEDLRNSMKAEGQGQGRHGNVTRTSGANVDQGKEEISKKSQKLAKAQYNFVRDNGKEQDVQEMVRQLSATAFILLDALCRNDELSRSFWNLHRALFASDVGQPGKGVGKLRILQSLTGDIKDIPVFAQVSKKKLLFFVDRFPGFVKAMLELVKALIMHPTSPNWDKNVAAKLGKMVDALVAMLKTEGAFVGDGGKKKTLIEILENVWSTLEEWKKSFGESGVVAPGARTFQSTAKEFLRRTKVFLEAPGNSQPGMIKGEEARRRITFFVNSLSVEQPKKKRVLEMPSLTTLTPYYDEGVVLSIESLRKETQDGVTELEYLRSIYPDEFDNFVERMRERTNSKMKGKDFDLDVMDPMLDIVLDTELGAKTSRSSVLERVKRAIITSVEKKRYDEGFKAIDSSKIEEAANNVDVDDMMLQLQLWASNRAQTLYRTVRGMMYYSQAVRLLAVVENIDEFQPKNESYLFGSSDSPGFGDVVGDVAQRQKARRADSGGDDPHAAWRINFWQKSTVVDNTAFKTVFNRLKNPSNEAMLDEELGELADDEPDINWRAAKTSTNDPKLPPRRRAPRGCSRSPVRPVRSPVVVEDFKGSRLKEAVRRVIEANRRKKEAAARLNFKGFINVQDPALNKSCKEYDLTEAVAEAKYRYVVSCQVFGDMQKPTAKEEWRQKAKDIKMLAKNYPGLRIAYVDKAQKGNEDPVYYSVLCKNPGNNTDDMVEEYRVRLPGPMLLGEAKPNNQNHAVIFTRGEAIQAIDMNQDASLEDAIKIRQVMEEFKFAKNGMERGRNIGRIVGFREHVFTHNVSAVANFFSLQELNFVSATQRALDNPLHVRFHYGHPDVFDRVSAITLGGISKACKGIHLSEDIFAGFNYVLRGGEATQADYIQVSKGRDTGVAQVTGFTAKISMGNGMQARSREVGRLASQFDIFRLLSFYYSSVGGFMNQVLLMAAVFLYVYAKLFVVFDTNFINEVDDEVLNAISTQFLFQLGFLLILPIPLLLAVEKGMISAVSTLASIMIRMAPLFFIFSAGTNAHYVNTAVVAGKAKYQATGRGFVIKHEYFVEMFPMYLASHFNPAFELLVALLVYWGFATTGYFLETFSVYLLIIGLLWTPLLFNPNGLDFTDASQDFSGWVDWMNSPVDDPKKSWLAWYRKELEDTRSQLPLGQKLQAVFRRSRLLILVYGFLVAIGEDYDSSEDWSWPGGAVVGPVMLIIVVLLMCQSWIRSKCCPKNPLKGGIRDAKWARLRNVLVVVGVFAGIIALTTLEFLQSAKQFILYILSFLILVYYISQIVVLFTPNALRDVALVNTAFKSVHFITGLVIILPVLLLSFIPLFVDLQTRMLFNEDFSQRFSIAKIFAKQSKRRTVKKNE